MEERRGGKVVIRNERHGECRWREEGGRRTRGSAYAGNNYGRPRSVVCYGRNSRGTYADRRSPIAIRTLARSRDRRVDTRDPTRKKLLRSQTPAGTTAKLPLSLSPPVSHLSARYAFSSRILSVETGKELVTRHIHAQGATKAR